MGLPKQFLNFDLGAEIWGTPGTPRVSQKVKKIFSSKKDFFCFDELIGVYIDHFNP